MEEENEEVDVIEFFQSKGTKLDSLKKEFLDITTSLELTVANNIGKEREYESLQQELKSLREQLTYTKRNIDEINSQQEVLKQTIEHINHKKESLYQKESSDRDEIQSFSSYFTELKDNLSIGYDWTPEQLEQRSILEKERDFIQSKLENTLNMLNAVRSDIERTYDAIQQKEEELLSNDQKLQSIEQHRNDIKKKISSLKNKKNSIDKKILEARSLVLYHEEELTKRSNSYKDEENALKQLDQSILRSKTKMELYLSQYEVLYRNLTEITSELEKQKAINKKIKQENDEKLKYCEEKTIEIKSISKELQKVNQLREIALTKTNEIDNEKKEIEININNINRTITTIRDIEINNIRKELDSLDKQIIQLKSELDVIRKKHTGSEKVSKSLIDLIQLNKNGKINLSLEKKVLEEEAELQKAQIRNLLTEKERYEHDGEIANQQYYTALEELKLQELQIQELNKKVNDDQMKLKQKQSMYESVRSDRNLYSKQLLDSQEEINLLKRNFRSMNHHIDQMKEEISVRDHSIVKEHFLHHSVDKERELLKNELTKIRKQVQSSELIVENQRVEIMKLQRIIEEADQERQRQKNELGAILSERNLLTGINSNVIGFYFSLIMYHLQCYL